jgi:hypothetical protein
MAQSGLKDICPIPMIVTDISFNFVRELTYNVASFETE